MLSILLRLIESGLITTIININSKDKTYNDDLHYTGKNLIINKNKDKWCRIERFLLKRFHLMD